MGPLSIEPCRHEPGRRLPEIDHEGDGVNSRKLFAIINRELGAFFASPIGYIVLFIYFLVGGFFFWLIVTKSHVASMAPVFQNLMFIFLFISPLITMRL